MGLAEFKARTLSMGGLRHGFDFQETSGVPLDYSATGRNGTVGTRGAINGASILPGAARSFRMLASVGSGTGLTVGSIAAGHPLQLTSQEFTVVQILRLDSQPTSGRRGLIERDGIWSVRAEASGLLRAYITTTNGISPEVRSKSALLAGETVLVAVRRRDPLWEILVNGSLEGAVEWAGAYPTTNTTTMTFASGGWTIDGNVQAHAVFNRYLDTGEIRQLTVDADSNLDRQGVLFDYIADDYDDLIASTDHDAYCGVTGGAMRVAEASRIPSGGTKRRPGPRAAVEANPYSPITGVSNLEDYGRRALQVGSELLLRAAVRGNSGASVWHDGTSWVSPEMAPGSQIGRRQHGGVVAAIIGRYLAGGGRGFRGQLPISDYVHIARKDIDVAVGLLDLPTSYRIADNEFALTSFGDLVWETRGLLPDAMWSEYRDMYLAACQQFAYGGVWSGGTEGNEIGYYVNPNRELGEHLAYINARDMWVGEGTNPWIQRVEDHWTFITAPPFSALPPSGRGDPLGRGYGEVLTVTPTNPDGRDGKGYLREHHGGGKGFFNIGATADNDAFRETVDVNGYDKSYTGTSLEHLGRAVVTHDEPRYLREMNLLRNRLRDNTNTTTWVIDATYGSRHCNNFTCNPAWDLAIALRTAGGRGDISTTETAACFNSWTSGLRQNVRTNRQTYWSTVSYSLGTIIQAQENYSR